MTGDYYSLNITERAQKRIECLILRELYSNLKLRISIESGGCAGLIYRYKITNVVNERDIVLHRGAVTVVLDPTSSTFLEGATLDYVEGFGKANFQINNPNATSRCGCGCSFSV
jgi:iron-sulfur cluster insertion protein